MELSALVQHLFQLQSVTQCLVDAVEELTLRLVLSLLAENLSESRCVLSDYLGELLALLLKFVNLVEMLRVNQLFSFKNL